jgi:hypothetical protein
MKDAAKESFWRRLGSLVITLPMPLIAEMLFDVRNSGAVQTSPVRPFGVTSGYVPARPEVVRAVPQSAVSRMNRHLQQCRLGVRKDGTPMEGRKHVKR